VRPQFKIENERIKEIFIDALGTKESPLTILRVQNMEFAFECGVHDDKITYSPFNSLKPNEDSINILSSGNYRYMIEEDTDLVPILTDHQYYMEKVTFPFFEKMSTLEGIDSFFNDVITEGDLPFFYSEYNQKFLQKIRRKREILIGVIAAKLNKRKNYEELLHRIKLLWEGNDYILNDFHKLVDYLEKREEIE
jgi:antitoxin component of RelBE/YafQ-DinJ toxin-antitoxin module